MWPREKRKEAAGRMKCIYHLFFFFQIAKNRTESHEASFISAKIMPNWKLRRVEKVTRRRVIHFWYAFLMQHCRMESIWLSMIHCLFIVKFHFFHRSLASQSHRHTTNKRIIFTTCNKNSNMTHAKSKRAHAATAAAIEMEFLERESIITFQCCFFDDEFFKIHLFYVSFSISSLIWARRVHIHSQFPPRYVHKI